MIYADNAATTKISEVAFEKMLPFLREQYGNASSQYSLGAKAKRAVEQARKQVAAAIGAEPSEITFTSGGSEANSWVLGGVAELTGNKAIHIVTSSAEHHSVLNACHALESKGVEVTYLPVNSCGLLALEDVRAAIKPNTKLVSIMLANNEIGTIQPIAEIGRYLREKDILFHTDSVQAVGHIPVDVQGLQVDFLSASAHKFNGPKGTGILYIRQGIELPPLIFGGEQENGQRAGTENTAGIVGMGYALEESIHHMETNCNKLETLVKETVHGIKEHIPNVIINGGEAERLPGILNLSFGDISGESLMHLLDLKGICVSTGSACTSGKNEPSHVLKAIGLSDDQALSAIRISYGKYNDLSDAEEIVKSIYNAYQKITYRFKI